MKPNTDQPKGSEAKPGSEPDPKDDLKSLPLSEVEKKLGSSPDGLTQAEAQKRLTQYGPNELTEKKTNLFLKFLSYFWGPIPWMIEIAVILSGVVGHWPDFFYHPFVAGGQRRGRILGRTSRRTNSESAFWRVSMNQRKTGNSVLQTFTSGNTGHSI